MPCGASVTVAVVETSLWSVLKLLESSVRAVAAMATRECITRGFWCVRVFKMIYGFYSYSAFIYLSLPARNIFIGASDDEMLTVQSNLASSYRKVGQLEKALRMRRDSADRNILTPSEKPTTLC